MVKISIEIRSGAAHFDVGVQVESIQRAVSFVQERYSKGTVRVRFPIEPESYFVDDPAARRRIVGQEPPARVAA
jgi:hypothetical protein